MRRRISLARWALALWDEVVRLELLAACDGLASQIEHEAEVACEIAAQRSALDAAQQQTELSRVDLSCEVQRKVAEAATLRTHVAEAEEENVGLLAHLEEERDIVEALGHEVWRLVGQRERSRSEGDPAITLLERQLREALDAQGSLRFSLLQSEAEADAVTNERDVEQAHLSELQERLEDSRRVYVQAVDALDGKIAGLTH